MATPKGHKEQDEPADVTATYVRVRLERTCLKRFLIHPEIPPNSPGFPGDLLQSSSPLGVSIELHGHPAGEVCFLAEIVSEHTSRRGEEVYKVLFSERQRTDPYQAANRDDMRVAHVED